MDVNDMLLAYQVDVVTLIIALLIIIIVGNGVNPTLGQILDI